MSDVAAASPWWNTVRHSGGFLEPCSSTAIRPRPPVALPDRGPFTFPAPYGTTGIRLTNPSDMGGQDALWPCGYSYWPNINAHASESSLLVFLGVDRNSGGGPSLWQVDKATDAVTFLGPIFQPDHPLSWSTGEGWYWSHTDPHILFASDHVGLYRVDVRTRRVETVVNIAELPISTVRTDEILWQFHTAHDDRTHSATVKGGESQGWAPLGTIIYREGLPDPWTWVPKIGALDESQIDQSGRWLLIKEQVDGQTGEDNRIIDLHEGWERVIYDQQGAAGHSDNGHGYMVAADNWNELPNAIRVWAFDQAQEPQGRVVYHSPVWDVELNHISHCNARPGPPDGQYAIGSGATRTIGPRANEIVAVPLDGSLRVLVIAPTMSAGESYDELPKANTDPTGQYVVWTARPAGRRDAFLVKVPGHLLR